MKTKRFIKWLLPVISLLVLLAGLPACSHTHQYFSSHRWYAKWYGRRRVSAMFEALKKEDYETAWKYWDPKKERSVEKLKKFLEHGEIPIITDFEIVWVEVFDFKRKDNPLITVYVNINHQEPPLALLVRYDELILYQH